MTLEEYLQRQLQGDKSLFPGKAVHHDVGGNPQVGSRWVNSSINLCNLFAAQMLILIVAGRLETVYFVRSSMLVALPGELVRQVRPMEVKHYKPAVIGGLEISHVVRGHLHKQVRPGKSLASI